MGRARKIEDPRFKCQALSLVARYWPHSDYPRLLKEVVEAGDSQNDAYKRMRVSAVGSLWIHSAF